MEIKDIVHLVNQIKTEEDDRLVFTVGLVNKLRPIIEYELSKLPFQINVIKSAARGQLKETAHSLILADLLRIPQIRESFIREYTNISEDDDYIVTAEKERIDVALRGKKHFVIIENKVNNAQEQESQVFRYTKIANEKYGRNRTYLVYLNSDTDKMPSDYSMTDHETGCCIHELINKENIRVSSYKYGILNWLYKVAQSDIQDQPYLESALLQYIDYLEEKFECSKRYNNMNESIRKELNESLGITSNTPEREKLEKVEALSKDLNRLISNISQVREQYEEDLIRCWQNQLRERYANIEHIEYYKFQKKEQGIVVQFQLENGVEEIALAISESKPWWGVRINNRDNSHSLYKALNEEFHNVETGTEFYWKYTSYENIMDRVHTLIELLKRCK